jgi:hypothetical protein
MTVTQDAKSLSRSLTQFWRAECLNWATFSCRSFCKLGVRRSLFVTHYAQTMRVLGPVQTETGDRLTDSLLAFSVSYRRA